MAGRKPLPTPLKILRGTDRKDRTNKNEPKPDLSMPSAPEHLSRYALMEWGRVTVELYQLGLLTDIDRAALAAYCQCYGRWREAEEELAKTGLTITTTNGNVIQNPIVGIANKSLEMMHKFLVEFGMTPSARTRVTPVGKDTAKKTNKWAM